MFKKLFLSIFVMIFIVSLCCSHYVLAADITQESITASLKKLESDEINEAKCTFDVTEDIITVKQNGKSCNMSYVLDESPTFTVTIPIQKSMTYEEYSETTSAFSLAPMYGYLAVTNIGGVDFKDSSGYFIMQYFATALASAGSGSQSPTIDEENFDPIAYLKELYKEDVTFNDKTSGIDSFEYTIGIQDVQTDSCNIVSTLKMNLEADYSKLIDYGTPSSGITKDNADYVVDLKVGQKCIIKSSKSFGYSFYDYNLDVLDDRPDNSTLEVVAESAGTSSITLIFGTTSTSQVNKTVFFNITENDGDDELEPVTLTVEAPATVDGGDGGSGSGDGGAGSGQGEEEPPKTPDTQEETPTRILPPAGADVVVYVLVGLSLVSIIVLVIKLKQYKDVK